MWPFSLLWARQQFPQNRYRPLTLPGRWLTEGVWSWEESREPEERAFTGSDSQRPVVLTKTPYFEVEVDLDGVSLCFLSNHRSKRQLTPALERLLRQLNDLDNRVQTACSHAARARSQKELLRNYRFTLGVIYFLPGSVFLDYWGDANWQWPVYLHDDGHRWHPSYDPDGQKPL